MVKIIKPDKSCVDKMKIIIKLLVIGMLTWIHIPGATYGESLDETGLPICDMKKPENAIDFDGGFIVIKDTCSLKDPQSKCIITYTDPAQGNRKRLPYPFGYRKPTPTRSWKFCFEDFESPCKIFGNSILNYVLFVGLFMIVGTITDMMQQSREATLHEVDFESAELFKHGYEACKKTCPCYYTT